MKKILTCLLAAVMVFTLVACGAAKEPAQTTQAAQTAKITVTVVHADGTEKEFTYETQEAFLGKVLTDAGLIEGNDGPYGLEITKVDGEQAIYNTDKAYWALYEGEEYALQGIDTTPVKDGGVYKLVYTGV